MGCYPCGVQSYELFFNITQKSVILFIHGGQSSDHRNLSTEHTEDTDILGSLRLEILEEIFFKNGLWPEIYSIQLYWKSKSLNKIFDQYAQQYVALWEESYNGSPYRLDILTIILKKIFN